MVNDGYSEQVSFFHEAFAGMTSSEQSPIELMDQIGPDPMFPLTPMQFRKPYGNTLRVILQPRQAGRSENVPESVLKGCRRWIFFHVGCIKNI